MMVSSMMAAAAVPGDYVPYDPAAILPISGAGGIWTCFRTKSALLVPVRYVSDKFGGELVWDPDTYVATIQLGGHTYRLQWGSEVVWIDGNTITLERRLLIDPRSSRMYISADDLQRMMGIGAVVTASGGEVVIDRGVTPPVDRLWGFAGSSWLMAAAASIAAFFFFKGRV